MSAYKPEQRKTTVGSAISDAISEIAELAGEMRERAENTPENFQQSDTYQTVENTASELENHTEEPDVPEALSDIPVEYTEMVQRRRGRGTSRATRCGNACAMLEGVVSTLDARIEELDPIVKKDEEEADPVGEDGPAEEARTTRASELEDAKTLRDECQEIVDDCEGLEFPGMRG